MKQDAASVLFIDRSLDLASVTNHQGETLLDRIIHMLPRLKDSNDVLVDMQSITAAPGYVMLFTVMTWMYENDMQINQDSLC